jgi:hypothetical protein
MSAHRLPAHQTLNRDSYVDVSERHMLRRHRPETPIERTFREVTGRTMSAALKASCCQINKQTQLVCPRQQSIFSSGKSTINKCITCERGVTRAQSPNSFDTLSRLLGWIAQNVFTIELFNDWFYSTLANASLFTSCSYRLAPKQLPLKARYAPPSWDNFNHCGNRRNTLAYTYFRSTRSH